MIKDKVILYDFIVHELEWAMRSSENKTERGQSNTHYHMERTLAYLEELINVFADEFGEEDDNCVSIS
jgi:hypothetical protein